MERFQDITTTRASYEVAPREAVNLADINHFFDRIFVINLDSCPDRWRKIQRNFRELGIENYERQPGIRLPRRNPFRHLDSSVYRNLEGYGGQLNRDPDYILNCVGTNMAHFQIVEKAQRRGYDRILVLEDDSYLVHNAKSVFAQAVEEVFRHEPWHMIYLGYKKSRPQFCPRRVSQHVARPRHFIRGAYGYALHRSAFPIILKHHLYDGMELDVFFEFFMCRYHRVFCFIPPIIGHRDRLQSTIRGK